MITFSFIAKEFVYPFAYIRYNEILGCRDQFPEAQVLIMGDHRRSVNDASS